MTAVHPTLNLSPKILRAAVDSTGNDIALPESQTIAAAAYSESFGFGNLPVDIEIRNIGAGTSGATDTVTIEISNDATFATTPLVNEEFGTVDFISVPVNASIMARNIESGRMYGRIRNTSTVALAIRLWYKPNRI